MPKGAKDRVFFLANLFRHHFCKCFEAITCSWWISILCFFFISSSIGIILSLSTSNLKFFEYSCIFLTIRCLTCKIFLSWSTLCSFSFKRYRLAFIRTRRREAVNMLESWRQLLRLPCLNIYTKLSELPWFVALQAWYKRSKTCFLGLEIVDFKPVSEGALTVCPTLEKTPLRGLTESAAKNSSSQA